MARALLQKDLINCVHWTKETLSSFYFIVIKYLWHEIYRFNHFSSVQFSAVCPKQDLKQQLKSMNKNKKTKKQILFSENPTKLSSVYEVSH